ncbi:MAG TPA: Ig-like domain-containing protein, partial [Gammaproteobacteria bacterium]|nr:Ig-like domain-containing protein [Gammaproteobacteria bacterium]
GPLFGTISNGQALGGAIFNLNGSVDISYSTLAGNILAGTAGDGGALYSVQLASPGSPAADASGSAGATVSSSILFASELNTTDSSGNVTSTATTDCLSNGGGFAGSPNVLGSTSVSCIQSGDSFSIPLLLPLANNGGPTQTMALVLPAGAGATSGAPALDQRGYQRNALAPDIGAYEISGIQKLPPSFSGLQPLTLIAGNNASLAWFNLSGNDGSQPVLTLSILSSNTTVLPAANLALSSNCGGSLALDTCSLSLTPTATKTGTANVTLIASNGYGQTGYGSIPVTVIPPIPVAKSVSVSVASGQTLNGTLTATDALAVTFSYAIVSQPTHGTLKLSSSSSSSYTYTPAAGYLGADSFTWKANDGASDSNVATVSITVTLPPPPLGAPTVSDMTLTTPANTALTGTLKGTGASLSFAIATQPSHGSVKLTDTGTGAFTYTPASGYNGSDSFTFTAENTLLKATSNPATVNITVGSGGSGSSSGGSGSGSNSVAPLASAMTLTTYTGTPLSGVLTASDAAGNTLSFSVTTPAHGSVKLTNAATGAFTYTPAAGFSGADSFTFTATDTVTGLSSAAAGVSLTVQAVPVSSQAVPLASNASFTTYENTAISASLSASDAAGNPLDYVLSVAPNHGTVVITAATGAFTYTPATGYTGSDSFTFTATDSVTRVSSAVATVALTMDALPPPSSSAPPVANPATLSTYEHAAVSGTLTGSSATGAALTYGTVGTTTTAHGSVTIAASGAFTYTPNAGYIGNDSFGFQVSDGTNTASATVSISVNALPPPAPVAGNVTVSTYLGIPVSGALSASDGAGNAITYPSSAVLTPNGSLTFPSSGTFKYTPTGGFTGSDSSSYTVTDSVTGIVSAPATLTFNVAPTPVSGSKPLASSASVTVYENKTLNSSLSGAPLASGDSLTYQIVTAATHGVASITPGTNQFTYTPASNYTGPDSFTFTVTDGTSTSTAAGVVITVAALPVAPTPPQASDASYSLYTGQPLSGALVAVDAAGDAVSYSAVQPSHGTVSVTASGPTAGAFTYTPNAGYVGSDSFSFTVIDSTAIASAPATVTLTVQALPITGVAPLANGGNLAVYAGQAAGGTLAAVDAGMNPLVFAVNPAPAHGKLKLDASSGAYTYTSDAGFTGKDSFSFTATDSVTHLASNTAVVNVTVAAVPLQAVAPLANDLNLTLYAGQTYIGMLSAIDVNGNPMNYAIGTQSKHGVATVDAKTGAFTYTPVGGYSGPDSFTYTATDTVTKLKSSTATASLDVTPAPPSAVHHGGPGRGGYGWLSLSLLAFVTWWRRGIALRRLLPALGACGLLWTVSVAADTDQPPPAPAPLPADAWYVVAQASIIRPDASRDAATHGPRGWGVLGGKEYGDFSFELAAGYHADNPKSLNGIANWKTFGVDGLWYFEHRPRLFAPFADAGVGFAEQYYGDDSTLRKPYLALGMGFDSTPWQSLPLFLRTDLQLQHVFSHYNDLILSFGVGFRFGGSTPPAAPLMLPDASPLDEYPMAWCAQEGGQAEETDSGWVCVLPGGKTESRPPETAPPAGTVDSPSAVTYSQPPAARLHRR